MHHFVSQLIEFCVCWNITTSKQNGERKKQHLKNLHNEKKTHNKNERRKKNIHHQLNAHLHPVRICVTFKVHTRWMEMRSHARSGQRVGQTAVDTARLRNTQHKQLKMTLTQNCYMDLSICLAVRLSDSNETSFLMHKSCHNSSNCRSGIHGTMQICIRARDKRTNWNLREQLSRRGTYFHVLWTKAKKKHSIFFQLHCSLVCVHGSFKPTKKKKSSSMFALFFSNHSSFFFLLRCACLSPYHSNFSVKPCKTPFPFLGSMNLLRVSQHTYSTYSWGLYCMSHTKKHTVNCVLYVPKYMSSSSIFCWLASVARVAIALHNSIKEGGGNKATLSGVRINISPDNNIQVIRRPLVATMKKRRKKTSRIY